MSRIVQPNGLCLKLTGRRFVADVRDDVGAMLRGFALPPNSLEFAADIVNQDYGSAIGSRSRDAISSDG